MIKPETLLNMTNEELRDQFRKEIIETKLDPKWECRLKEYHDNIERDFQEEWSKKHFKWFFTKRRQKKLRAKVARRYTAPVFWLIEEVIDDILVKQWEAPEFFEEFIDIKKIANEVSNTDIVCEFCGSKDVTIETAVSLADPLAVQEYHRIKCCSCGKILSQDYEEKENE